MLISEESDELRGEGYHTIFDFISLCVSRIVTAQHTHNDDSKEPSEQDDEHERVHDGKPVDLTWNISRRQGRGKEEGGPRGLHGRSGSRNTSYGPQTSHLFAPNWQNTWTGSPRRLWALRVWGRWWCWFLSPWMIVSACEMWKRIF